MAQPLRMILLDVNVLIDNYLSGRRHGEASRRLIDACRLAGIDMVYSASSVQNVFYVVTSTLKRAIREEGREVSETDARAISRIAWECVDNLEEIGAPVGVDASDLWLARKHCILHADFEDDLVIASCLRAKVDYLVTNDEALLKKAPVAALTSADMLSLLKMNNSSIECCEDDSR